LTCTLTIAKQSVARFYNSLENDREHIDDVSQYELFINFSAYN